MSKPCMSSNGKRGMNKRRKASHISVKCSGPSCLDLPKDIFQNILLSIKRIFVCKSVGKTWYNLISNPEFAKLHFDQAQVYPLIRAKDFTVLSRTVYLVQPGQEDFELKLDCYHTSQKRKLGWAVMLRLNLIPNLDSHRAYDKHCIVNSYNGLLCLSELSTNEPVIVCNPVTGEFINLPEERTIDFNRNVACGFGFSPMTNQYKALRIFEHFVRDDITYWFYPGMVAEIHILGTKSWKSLGFFPYLANNLVIPTYLNGYLYWYYDLEPPSVMYFDIETDCFGSFSPPLFKESSRCGKLGVLGGELCCLAESFELDRVDFWVLKACDGKKDWFNMLSINMNDKEGWLWSSYQSIKYLNNGALLMFNPYKQAFMYHDPKKHKYKYLMISGMHLSGIAFGTD